MKPDLPKDWGMCWCRWCRPRNKKGRRMVHKKARQFFKRQFRKEGA